MSESGIVNIRGKQYETVALRVQKFREQHPDWALVTEMLYRDADCVVMRASILDAAGVLLATGHAEEYRASSQINRTSALENAETSAIGRALAALGFGGTEFATANEVQNAIHQQETAKPMAARQRHLELAKLKDAINNAPNSESLKHIWKENNALLAEIGKQDGEAYNQLVDLKNKLKFTLEEIEREDARLAAVQP